MKGSLFFSLIFILLANVLQAQITAPTADTADVTQYPVFAENDDIFIFCTSDSLAEVGALTAVTELEGTKTFKWEKYNEQTAAFELVIQESLEGNSSQLSGLADGCYRSTITQGDVTEIDRAWVFNNWIVAGGSVSDSNCESFRLNGEFKSSVLNYYDLGNNSIVPVAKDIRVEWQEDGEWFSALLEQVVKNPPAKNTNYTLRVYDKFGCEANASVYYESIVTKAEFSADPMEGEAPLDVTFSNTSLNGSPGYYEWIFYRELGKIKEESEGAVEPVDSIDFVAFDDAPVYTYQNSGTYMVKLISKHVSEFFTCADTFTLDGYIVVDTANIVVPNVFTPNGDGVNDVFTIRFESMKSLEISIFNRWGRRVHYWESGNVEGFEATWAETVWDGKIGGRYASPGVYYYDVRGLGRDGKKKSKKGFVHVFRDKD